MFSQTKYLDITRRRAVEMGIDTAACLSQETLSSATPHALVIDSLTCASEKGDRHLRFYRTLKELKGRSRTLDSAGRTTQPASI